MGIGDCLELINYNTIEGVLRMYYPAQVSPWKCWSPSSWTRTTWRWRGSDPPTTSSTTQVSWQFQKHLISKSTLYLSRLWYIQRVERDWQEPGGRASLPQRHAAAGSIPLTWAPKVAWCQWKSLRLYIIWHI